MIKTIFFIDKDFDEENITELITELEDYNNEENNIEVKLYLSSCGGYIIWKNVLLEYLINYRPLKEVIFMNNIQSSLFMLLLELIKNDIPCQIKPVSSFMMHDKIMNLDVHKIHVKNTFENFYYNKFKNESKEYDKLLFKEFGIPDTDIDLIYNEGVDKYYTYDEMLKFIEYYKNNHKG